MVSEINGNTLHRHAVQIDQVVAPAHHVAVNRMEVEVLEVVGTRHDLGTTRRAVDPASRALG